MDHDPRRPALNHPPRPRTASCRPPAAGADDGPDLAAGRVRGAGWAIGLATAIAVIDVAIAFDAFVLRPILSRGDPRGVVRVAVVLGAVALAAKVRHRPHRPTVPPASADDTRSGPTSEPEGSPPPDVPTGPSPPTVASHSPRRQGLEVHLLGPVVVRGAATVLTPKSVELVVYLACHPEGIHEERIKAALWPARAPRPQTWLNRVSATRKGLGRSVAGAPRLPPFDRHVGRLHPSVPTDVDSLAVARSEAKHQAPPAAAATLAQALELVRGRPFDMATGYEWAFTELHVAHAERVVVDVAHDLAGLALTLGDWRRTLWATDTGLLACPASEVLFQDRMRACAAGGDRHGIESSMRDLRRTLATADSSDVPSRDTVELYEHLRAHLQSGAPTDPPRVTLPTVLWP